MPETTYLFQSDRLGFRNWKPSDVTLLALINKDPVVMEFFLGIPSEQQTTNFISRMQKQLEEKGFCYFAVDKLENSEFIGFIGLSEQTFAADFTPCVDIGWRLHKKEWGKGLATEGAKRCLEYGFSQLNLDKIHAVAPAANKRSEQIMKKIGMKKIKNFIHPLLINDERLRDCVLYEVTKQMYTDQHY